ncbi:MAG: IS3 family transposase [Bryobacteraceae bacterium]
MKAQLRQARSDVDAIRAQYAVSERQACGLMELAVSSYRYRARPCERADTLRVRLTELAQQYPRFGSPRLCALVRREDRFNHKLVERVYREAGLSLRRKKRRRLLRQRTPIIVTQSLNEEWAMDFVTDSLASARHLRILTVVDVFTRECLALEADTSIGSLRVQRVLDRIMGERGAPLRLRCDNGPEFTSRSFLAWALERKIELVHIRPGKPVENAYIESFNGRLREECLNASWFRNLFDARQQIERWREHYNQVRPHSALRFQTPNEFALAHANARSLRAEVGRGDGV